MQGLTSRVVLGEGGADFDRRQSVFGLTRARRERNAGIERASGDRTGHRAAALVVLWRSRATFELKAATLACGALLATPYVYMYDLVVLAVAVAYLLRDGVERGFSSLDGTALAAAAVLVLIYPYVPTKVGLAAVLIIGLDGFSHLLRRSTNRVTLAALPIRQSDDRTAAR